MKITRLTVLLLLLLGAILGAILVRSVEAQAPKPYMVYKIHKGCLYVVSNQAGIDAVFVPDDEIGICHP